MGAQAPRNPKEARDPKIKPAGNAAIPVLAMYPWVSVPTLAVQRGTLECIPGERVG